MIFYFFYNYNFLHRTHLNNQTTYVIVMKAKKIVKVELKRPALRRVRKNFRDVIKFAVEQESSRLYAKSGEYRKRSQDSSNPAEKKRLEQKKKDFRSKSNELDRLLSDSIIQCGLGAACSSLSAAIKNGFDPLDRPTDLDMAWCPYFKAWFCVPCTENLIGGAKILREERHPDHMRHLRERGLISEEEFFDVDEYF